MKFHTQLKAKDIFKFSLAYTYSGVQAILTIFMLGVGAYMIVHGIGQPEGQTNIIFGVLGEESATIEWNRVYKITHFMGLTLLYTGKQQAFVFPDYELGDDREKMLDYMKEHIKEARKKAVQTQTDGGDISKYSKASAETEQEETEVETETQVEASGSEVQEKSEGEE